MSVELTQLGSLQYGDRLVLCFFVIEFTCMFCGYNCFPSLHIFNTESIVHLKETYSVLFFKSEVQLSSISSHNAIKLISTSASGQS